MSARIARPDRSPPALVAAILAIAALAVADAREAQAASYRSCGLSLTDQEPPGGTPAYDLKVKRRATSCRTAKQVSKAFHRCRTASSFRCARKLLGAWRCTAGRDPGTRTVRGTFTCRSGSRRVRGSYRQDTPRCYGAAARDPKLRCFNPTRSISPGLGEADPDTSWVCDADAVPGACVFGVPEAHARGHFALLGDSHTLHWRAPLSVVADVERWRGYSISAGGCFFSEAVGSFSEGCLEWYRAALAWFEDHPEVDTVFVTQNADTPVAVPPGRTSLEVKVEGFRRAWQALPKTVRHIVVLRDTTISTQATFDCVVRVVRAGTQRLATACPLPRATALREDAAVAAVRRLRSPRYQYIDLSEFMCSRGNCYPVVGGTLVNGDVWGHLNPTFMRTLGPYLLRELRALMASW